MNFTEQPTGTTGVFSPLIYQVYDANFGLAGFYYKMEVFVWSGAAVLPASPIATINRKADQFGGGRGWIDIRKIAAQYVDSNILINGTYLPDINQGAEYVAVQVQAIWDAGSSAIVPSNIELVTNGYNYVEDGLNADFSSKNVYTDRETIYLTEETTEFYIWFDRDIISSIDAGAFSQGLSPLNDSNDWIRGIDIVQLMSNAALTGVNTTINFQKALGGQVDIDVVYNCQNRHGEVLIHYLNKYGVYESFVFNALSRSSKAIDREEYQQPIYKNADLTDSFGFGLPITTTYLSNFIKSVTVNTDYIPESYNEIIQQIMISRNILLIDGTDVFSVRVTDSSFVEKKRVNDKLIQYTLRLEYNQPVINDIAR